MKDIYQDFAKYNLWANQKMVNLFSNLSDEVLEKEIINSFPSIRLTFLHIWDAEQVWLNRLRGISMTSFPSNNFNGSNQEMFEKMLQFSAEFLEFIKNQEPSFFEEPITYQNTSAETHSQPSYEIIHHVFNHSTYHRGQLTMMARQIGLTEIEGIDYIRYLRM